MSEPSTLKLHLDTITNPTQIQFKYNSDSLEQILNEARYKYSTAMDTRLNKYILARV